jgi:TRAP transporter 4TM/12TM fusion protein
LRGLPLKVVLLTAAAMSLYHLTIAFIGIPEPMRLRPVHVGFAMFLGYCLYPFRKKTRKDSVPWYDWVLALLSVSCAAYIQIDYARIAWRYPFIDPLTPADIFFGVLVIVLVLELARRVVGWGLVGIALLFIIHTLYGRYMPGILYHPGVKFTKFIDHIYLTVSGLYGGVVNTSATYIFLFILFGSFLQAVGASQFFMNMAISITKKARGGPAKASVIASAFFGMISGSAVANVYTTGSITIPLMIKSGFKRHFAGGVEAVSSASGQVMPPIMGSAAFLIAEFTMRPYKDIALASAIPSLLYLLAVYWMVHFQALKTNLPMYRLEDIKEMRQVMKNDAHLLLPIILLVVLLLADYTPYFAAFYSSLALVAVSWFRRHTRVDLRRIWDVLVNTATKATPIAVAISCAGLLVGTTEMTGVPYKFSAAILDLSQGHLPVALALIAVSTIILGMDLPIVVSFTIASLFGVPALVELGVDRFVAYMFVFYYAILATITPPVCMSAYAAASIAGSTMFKTGFQAMQIGIASYIIPVMFVYSPQLLYQGDVASSLQAGITAAFGIIALASSVQGYFITQSRWYERICMAAVALLLIKPGLSTDAVGAALLAAVMLLQCLRAKRSPWAGILGKVTG